MTNIKALIDEGWEITDPSCNQMRKEIVEDKIYSFRENRIINPITKETKVFEETLNYYDYSWFELVEACEAFGYNAKTIDKWITAGEEIPLMLECIFELDT